MHYYNWSNQAGGGAIINIDSFFGGNWHNAFVPLLAWSVATLRALQAEFYCKMEGWEDCLFCVELSVTWCNLINFLVIEDYHSHGLYFFLRYRSVEAQTIVSPTKEVNLEAGWY